VISEQDAYSVLTRSVSFWYLLSKLFNCQGGTPRNSLFSKSNVFKTSLF